ncbi:Methyl-accepting chemotaxis protein [Richelia intracellularis HH01]|uniref:Methyl-accepting chemotaxis protein n=1 Tax=Richelia intracellularis HH01 TaxID=1165094 RepID=M1WSG0_9NOST|nr:Methyl-accepting chemotaxis protein [Richelia intracellularis HH01]
MLAMKQTLGYKRLYPKYKKLNENTSVNEPLFWLGLSILLVAISLTAVLTVAIPALQDLSRAARSAEKLFDTLSRELPPTLESIRLTGLEITELSDDVSEGVKSATKVAKQVDHSLNNARRQAQNISTNTRSLIVGIKAAWQTFKRSQSSNKASEIRLSSFHSVKGPSYHPDGETRSES